MDKRIIVAVEDPAGPDAVALLDALSDTLAAITGSSGRASFDVNDVRGDKARFVLGLETRLVNTRAVHFYERHGYSRIPNYGRYIGRPEAVCFEKTLGAG